MPSERTNRLPLTIFLAVVLLAAGCAPKADDREIAQKVQSQIQKDAAINGQVSVQSADGTVTLTGQVPSAAARELAAREAGDTPGVKQVVNNLVVADSASAARRPVRRARKTADTAPRAPAKEIAASIPPEEPAVSNPAPAAPAPVASGASKAPPAPAEPAPAPPLPPPPAPVKYTIAAGKTITVRLIDSLDSTKNKAGDTFRASLNVPIRVDGEVAVPFGADVEGRVIDASNAGRFSGHAELKLELTKLTSHGHAYPLTTEDYGRAGDGRGKGTAEAAGGGAVLGAIIGALGGGGKGAAIGTVAGAGAGGAARGVKKGKGITFPSETVLTFKLQEPVTVITMPGEDEPARR